MIDDEVLPPADLIGRRLQQVTTVRHGYADKRICSRGEDGTRGGRIRLTAFLAESGLQLVPDAEGRTATSTSDGIR
ncbi:hypothetical protein ACH4VR_25405 [Streptomyces sp. NPDC020883]|uniref:hypothetical protein n=1 Tax=Streptomyces sp. NPDC020883 TaxID=3365099 RepID=UPI00378F1D0E